MQFTAVVTNSNSGVTWTVASMDPAGAAGLAGGAGSLDASGNFTAPTVTQNSTVAVTATSVKDPTKSATATVTIIAPAVVASTANAQIAQYTIAVPDSLSAFVQFSTDTSYGLTTWSLPAPSGGGPVSILVAGMKGNTPYHMRALFQPTGTNTTVFTDVDHTFTTSAYPTASLPSLTVTTATGQTPQPGIELLSLIGAPLTAVATDLSGNVIWAYDPGSSLPAGTAVDFIKAMPNGHFLVLANSNAAVDGTGSVIQEIDLTGQVFWQMTAAQLNAALATATCSGCNITVVGNHHDFAILPNGHIITIAATTEVISGVTVTGDVLIDLDQNHNPVWLWNEFDHLDVNRHPMQFPDWTHTNSVVYSPDDKALMVSMRHQAWVVKVNYNDGTGDGSILWKLGYQGDFNLLPGTTNATSPVDWFNAQHDANFSSTTTAGTLDVILFDNGNQRILDNSGTLCGPTTTPCDSRVPILHLDENAKTADITWVNKLAPVFAFFGGSARLLANGNVEFAECGLTAPALNSAVYEVTKTSPPQTVWQMQVKGHYAYRAIRMGSLYPGVQW
jgi:hypothetical protein